MTYRLLVHPRGFSRVVTPDGVSNTIPYTEPVSLRPQRIDEDSSVEQMMRRHLGNDEYVDWAIRRQELALCAGLYGNFRNWVEFQLARNGFIYDMSLDFLIDTLRFISTGQRTMQAKAWKDILEVNPIPKPTEASPARIARVLDIVNRINWDDFMAQWISQPGGYDDMIYSTYVFFGKL